MGSRNALKFEARNPKYETISNDQNPNDKNFIVQHALSTPQHGTVVSVIETFEL